MKDNLMEIILNDLKYQNTEKNRNIIQSIVSDRVNDISYVWTKIPALTNKISHVKGFLGISNSKQAVKIGFDRKAVSSEINKEFHTIVENWSRKYKISLSYDFEKETFYIN